MQLVSEADRRMDWRVLAFAAALLTYGLLGAPAPAGIRAQELLVFAGIAALAGVAVPWRFFTGQAFAGGSVVMAAGSLIMTGLLWQGLLRGLWNGWGLTDMVRDIVPMLFLCLPLLLAPPLSRLSDDVADRLADAAALAGVAFALRWWRDAGLALSAIGASPLGEGRDYLLNSALVPFAAVWLGLRAAHWLAAGTGRWGRVQAGLALGGSLCCLLALAATLHRAGLGLSVLALAFGLSRLGFQAVARRPALAINGLLLLLAILLALRLPMAGILGLLADKTESVGLNNRLDEMLAVLDQVGRDPVAFLIGDGWGALVANPAVGWWRVSYTHSAASYFLLKLGAVGLALVMVYAGMLAGLIARSADRQPLLVLAVGPSLVLALFLHTSFKYLCFSLLLSLVVGRAVGGLYKR